METICFIAEHFRDLSHPNYVNSTFLCRLAEGKFQRIFVESSIFVRLLAQILANCVSCLEQHAGCLSDVCQERSLPACTVETTAFNAKLLIIVNIKQSCSSKQHPLISPWSPFSIYSILTTHFSSSLKACLCNKPCTLSSATDSLSGPGLSWPPSPTILRGSARLPFH